MHTKLNKNLHEYANNEVDILTLEKPVITGHRLIINFVCESLFQNKFGMIPDENKLLSYVSPT